METQKNKSKNIEGLKNLEIYHESNKIIIDYFELYHEFINHNNKKNYLIIIFN